MGWCLEVRDPGTDRWHSLGGIRVSRYGRVRRVTLIRRLLRWLGLTSPSGRS